ncbi:DUF4230 domain-containing protein [Lacinutrix venerupis]|uniref:DUF4230 domain-containing protein n=1 Tax=Lacinutrix venerupis TaxID=1486034 RepID=A0AAC9LJ88_9FLAO|nr:DUF4230 domain-containing protein [Lacinutrix venerupis]APX99309.1 hypothetical protein BWR22_02955 [Lacinutrix venerupis]
MEIVFAIIFGVLSALGVSTYVKHIQSKKLAQTQSVVLLDKIKKVCKIISVEGDFAEIYHYENVKERFLKLVSSRKKALVIIDAKAHVGFDLSKIQINANAETKLVTLKHFPQPEILSIETNLKYYDKRDGMFNKFQANDLTTLHNEAKLHIREKVPQSGLFQIAQKEALDSILLIEGIVETIGWKLDYSALEIEENSVKELKND